MKLYQVAYELVGKLSSSFNTSMFSASESLQGLNNKLEELMMEWEELSEEMNA